MELIQAYLERFPGVRYLKDIDSKWHDFHKTQARTISVIGGRGSGKTYNLIQRAIHSDKDCVFLVPHRPVARLVYEEILGQTSPEDFHRCTSSGRLTFNNGKEILIHTYRDVEVGFFRGKDLSQTEVYADELYNQRMNDNLDDLFNRSYRVVAAGSARYPYHSSLWHRQAEFSQTIPSRYLNREYGFDFSLYMDEPMSASF